MATITKHNNNNQHGIISDLTTLHQHQWLSTQYTNQKAEEVADNTGHSIVVIRHKQSNKKQKHKQNCQHCRRTSTSTCVSQAGVPRSVNGCLASGGTATDSNKHRKTSAMVCVTWVQFHRAYLGIISSSINLVKISVENSIFGTKT